MLRTPEKIADIMEQTDARSAVEIPFLIGCSKSQINPGAEFSALFGAARVRRQAREIGCSSPFLEHGMLGASDPRANVK